MNDAHANPTLAWAEAYLRAGLRPIPIAPRTKDRPLVKWKTYQDAAPTAAEVEKWFIRGDSNIALILGRGLIAVDFDGEGAEQLLADAGVELPESAPRSKTARGCHVLLRVTEPLPNSAGLLRGDGCQIDIRADGGYIIAAPSVHPSGHVYEWERRPGAIIPEAPAALVELIKRHGAHQDADTPASAGGQPLWVAKALQGVGEGQRDDTCARLAGYLIKKSMGADVVKELLYGFAGRCRPPLPRADVDKTVDSILRRHTAARTEPATAQVMPDAIAQDDLARIFTSRHGSSWRYIAAWGRWMEWDGARWVKEDTHKVFDLVREICRNVASSCPPDRRGQQDVRIRSAQTVAAVERLAQADRAHAATVDQWDRDPWLLNTPAGIIDLRTGTQRPHDSAAHMTKIASASLGGECPRWRTFLREVTAGDEQLERYLARVVGYALTGRTTEQALFFFHGTGANGKSVFLNTLGAILGDYATTAPIDTFLASQNERHPTDVAMLRGARLVSSIELTQGRRWDEAKLKSLTGGDRVSARFMRGDFFEYTPQFKLLIAGNNKPGLRDVDEAMRRRLHLIPFTVRIPPERRQHDLAERLFDERDGILTWAVEGCLEWQRNGLQPPQRVVEATDEYFQAEDELGRWLKESCETGPAAGSTLTSALWTHWRNWAEAAGAFVGTEKRFSQDLAARSFARDRQAGTGKSVFRGIALKPGLEPDL